MIGLESVVVVGLAVIVGSIAAQRLRLPAPVPLLFLGIAIAFIPHFREVGVPPSVVLFLFLPALLFWESLTSSVRSLRTFVRPILLTSTVLVAITAFAVAWVAHLFGVPWRSAWLLGAAIAPTDATVVASMGSLLPRRTLAVLRSESLLNDGTALVVYSVAMAAATEPETGVEPAHIALRFVISIVGGIAAGLLTGWVVMFVRRRLVSPMHDNAVLVLTPFVAYLLAEQIEASGVLAVVTAGLYLMRTAPGTIGAHPRTQSTGFWSVTNFLLNGSLFVLVGLRMPHTISGLRSIHPWAAAALAVALLVTLFVVRYGFLLVSDELVRAELRIRGRESPSDRRTAHRAGLVTAVAGFRGAVSLAMALSVPTMVDGHDFPSRDAVLFCTSMVVLGTIVIQGLLLPRVVRWADLPDDDTMASEFHDGERESYAAALEALPDLAAQHEVDHEVQERIAAEFQTHLDASEARSDEDEDDASAEAVETADRIAALRSDLVDVRRRTIVGLRDEGRIDDEVLLELQRSLDREELRWSDDIRPQAGEE